MFNCWCVVLWNLTSILLVANGEDRQYTWKSGISTHSHDNFPLWEIEFHPKCLSINSFCCVKADISFGNGNKSETTIHLRFLGHLPFAKLTLWDKNRSVCVWKTQGPLGSDVPVGLNSGIYLSTTMEALHLTVSVPMVLKGWNLTAGSIDKNNLWKHSNVW